MKVRFSGFSRQANILDLIDISEIFKNYHNLKCIGKGFLK